MRTLLTEFGSLSCVAAVLVLGGAEASPLDIVLEASEEAEVITVVKVGFWGITGAVGLVSAFILCGRCAAAQQGGYGVV